MSQTDRATGLVGYSGVKVPVRVASTGVLTLSGEQTIDGIACVEGDRVLVKNQASAVDNGIYVVDSGDWELAKDADGPYDYVGGTLVPVFLGTTNARSVYQLTTTGTIEPGTSSMTFVAFGLLTVPVGLSSGGTGATTAVSALANLGVVQVTAEAGTNTITGTVDALVVALRADQLFIFTPANTNTGAVTAEFTPSGGSSLGAKNVFLYGVALKGGELVASVPQIWHYDGTQFNILWEMRANTVSVAAHATTMNPWQAKESVLTGAVVTFTNIAAAPYASATVWLRMNAAHVWTNGATFNVMGGANYTCAAGDWVRLRATTTSTFDVTIFPVSGASVNATSMSIDRQTFLTAGANTWPKPTGKGTTAMAFIQNWGAGGSGGKGAANAPEGGAGGGGYNERWIPLALLGATETATVGAGGVGQTTASTAGNAGGNSTFGTWVTAYGGGGGGAAATGGGGGGGGGILSAGSSGSGGVGGQGGLPSVPAATAEFTALGQGSPGDSTNYRNGGPNQFGGGGGAGTFGAVGGKGGDSVWGGGGGGGGTDGAGVAATNAGGNSLWGGGGGGGAADSVTGGSAGTSQYGGNGSAGAIDANASSAGTQPGGGSGGTEGGDSGKGGDGQIIVTVFPGA